MANTKVYSRSNLQGSALNWKPTENDYVKYIRARELAAELVCDGVNDFRTTYVAKRIWDSQKGIMTAPLYVNCEYVE